MAPSVQQKGAGSLWLNTVGRRTHPACPAAGFPFHIAEIYERSHAMSTQTAHLGLHQWESTDSFLREDFNQDNRKIDEKVGGLLEAQALIPLMTAQVTEQVTAVEFDLSGIDLTQYCELQLKTSGLCAANVTVLSATFNDDKTDGHYTYAIEGVAGGSNTGRAIELSRVSGNTYYCGWKAAFYPAGGGILAESYSCYLNGAGNQITEDRRFGATTAAAGLGESAVHKLTLTATYYDLASGTFYLYGVKR